MHWNLIASTFQILLKLPKEASLNIDEDGDVDDDCNALMEL